MEQTAAARFDTPASRWRAVQSRSPAAASAFVYGVVTTRIFCRPTCPARLARRANVVFFDEPAVASQAGFRACKRCRPHAQRQRPHGADGDQEEDEGDARRNAAIRARRALDERHGVATWKEVAEAVRLSARYLHHAFKSTYGVTPGAYAQQLRRRQQAAAAHAAAGTGLPHHSTPVNTTTASVYPAPDVLGPDVPYLLDAESTFAADDLGLALSAIPSLDTPQFDAPLSLDGAWATAWDDFILYPPDDLRA